MTVKLRPAELSRVGVEVYSAPVIDLTGLQHCKPCLRINWNETDLGGVAKYRGGNARRRQRRCRSTAGAVRSAEAGHIMGHATDHLAASLCCLNGCSGTGRERGENEHKNGRTNNLH